MSVPPTVPGRPPRTASTATDRIAVVDAFLTPGECRLLRDESERGAWVASRVDRIGGRDADAAGNGGRNSLSLALPAYSDAAQTCLSDIERRLQVAFGLRPRHLEPWQMTRYRRGDGYGYHIDGGAWARHPAGERARTILIVLESPTRGGATHFRALGTTIRPLVGRLIVWRNLLPTGHCDHAMIHAGRTVWQGRKTILTTWEHERPFPHRRQGDRNGRGQQQSHRQGHHQTLR